MPERVAVQPELLRWARRRARLDVEDLERKFPKLAEWEAEQAAPTLRQLEAFAHATHAPLGYLLLDAPPAEPIPIPDFRTRDAHPVPDPSADLLDTIFICQERQDWYRDHLREEGARPLAFVGSVDVGADVVSTAQAIGTALAFDLETRRHAATWEDALRGFVEHAEVLGILVMRNGVVGNNTHRKLDTDEFRGFTLSDPVAPLVFVNAADTKSAQMFTLVHELVHVWSGESALGDESLAIGAGSAGERWCDAVAAELLVPAQFMRTEFDRGQPLAAEIRRLARRFKVSTLVVLRRARDIGAIDAQTFHRAFEDELDRLRALGDRGTPGGNFHSTEAVRVSRIFARALVDSALEGRTLYRDAFRLLGISKLETFRDFGQVVGAGI
jgi:Zn-dependent peptidase ImmA (M78 family)/transcriptional regulator with XRE-family HTH domain